MTSPRGISAFLTGLVRAISGTPRTGAPRGGRPQRADAAASAVSSSLATVAVAPPRAHDLRLEYAPSRDGDADAGEIVWTWVPYEENDGRGKDRPVLVIARHGADRVYAVRLTSKPHDRNRDYLSIGTGPWDGQGRPSWVDIEQLYSVHVRGLRREAAALDRTRFARVAAALQARYGWTADGPREGRR